MIWNTWIVMWWSCLGQAALPHAWSYSFDYWWILACAWTLLTSNYSWNYLVLYFPNKCFSAGDRKAVTWSSKYQIPIQSVFLRHPVAGPPILPTALQNKYKLKFWFQPFRITWYFMKFKCSMHNQNNRQKICQIYQFQV